ncbi:hypothetical protein AAFM79_18100 [Trichormus azollae HNT15244]
MNGARGVINCEDVGVKRACSWLHNPSWVKDSIASIIWLNIMVLLGDYHFEITTD